MRSTTYPADRVRRFEINLRTHPKALPDIRQRIQENQELRDEDLAEIVAYAKDLL